MPRSFVVAMLSILHLSVGTLVAQSGASVRSVLLDGSAVDFATVSHASILDDGRIVLGLRGDYVVGMVGLNGSVRRLVRRGGGPAEVSAALPPIVGADGENIWIADPAKRILVVNSSGAPVRSIPWITDLSDPGGSGRVGSYLVMYMRKSGEMVISVRKPPGTIPSEWAREVPAGGTVWLLMAPDGTVRQRLAVAATPECRQSVDGSPRPILLCGGVESAASHDGRWLVVTVQGDRPGSISRTIVGPSPGQLVAGSVAFTAVAISAGVKDSIRRQLASYGGPPEVLERVRRQPIADHYPAVAVIVVGNDGRHLIRSGYGLESGWHLFDAAGRKLRAPDLPPGFIPKLLLPDAVIGVERDGNDEERVVRYRLQP